MDNVEFDLPLPKKQKELLVKLVDRAKAENILSVPYVAHSPDGMEHHLSFIFPGNTNRAIDIDMPEDPIPGFEALGFIICNSGNQMNSIFLTPKLFKWVKYEKKNMFGKFWAKLPGRVKDFMIIIAFILSLALTTLQILENLGPTP